MTSFRHGQHDGADTGGEGLPGTRPSDLYPPGFWGPSGGEGGAAPRPPAPTPAMPKMGVRARIADWPPKREAPRDPTAPSPSRDSEPGGSLDFPSPRGVPNGQPAPVACLRAAPRFSRRRSKDVEFPEGWPRSPGRGWAPLRHRSSSEVTLSECEVAEEVPALGTRVANGLPLFREYGSTSSINAQGLSEQSFVAVLRDLRGAPAPGDPSRDGLAKEKPRKKAPKGADAGGDSIFRKLRSGRSEPGPEPAEDGRAGEGGQAWLCPKGFAHYDAQSLLFDLRAAAASRAQPGQRRNTTTGASAASADAAGPEELNGKESLEHDPGDATSNDLLLSCPHFRNEIGGLSERSLSFARGGAVAGVSEGPEPPLSARCTNAGVSVLEVPPEQQRDPGRLQRYSIEHVDLGAHYYRDYFHGKEHSNYFGVDEKLGPVAVSIRRERLEDHKEHGPQYQYRLIFRTSELATLRGSVLEDAIPTTTKPGTGRGLPLKDALEYVVPELNIHCLRLALTAAPAKVTEQLLKLDEQGICRKHKVGILYCKAGQSSEEEMYNNEAAGPAFEEFLELLGDRVCLRAFGKYAAQLDTKTDSTGTHSLYTTYQDYEIMFHVSTMLPYTPNNRQQLLRKRHIGNDIVTIVFQEPGALPFTPQSVRSHFQHVFIVVRAHSPCTDSVCYSVAVTRSKDVPPFGPPIPRGATFRRSELFRDFLLAKAVNAEHAAHKSAKFKAMATRTRQEYLRDLAERCGTGPPLDAASKFSLMALASKRREKARARAGAELLSAGALAWHVRAQDFGRGAEVDCALAVSSELVALLDLAAKEVAFHCFCADVIGWTADAATLKVFYGRGDHVLLRAPDETPRDVQEIVQRLKVVTSGCETVDMTLRRNGLGQLGFHVRYDGTVAEVEEYGFAWQAGLRQGSRLVEICKVAVVTLSHDQMIDLLRTSVTVKVVIVPPHEDGTPRRGWAESLEAQGTEPKAEPETAPTGYRPPYRSHSAWQWNGPASHNPGGRWSEALPLGHGQSLSRPPKQAPAAVPYRDPQPPHGKRPVSFPETPHLASPAGTERPQPYRQPSGSFSAPGSSGAIFTRYKPSPERYATASPRSLLPFEPPHYGPDAGSSGDSSSGGLGSQDSTMERHKPEPLWHVPAPARLPAAAAGLAKRPSRQELAGKDSPNRPPKGEAQYSSHSSSNTLSSNASSSHSDEPWFDAPDPAEPEPDPASVGGSSDSGIDTALYTSSPGARPARPTPAHTTGLPENGKRREPAPAGQSWGYRHKGYAGSAESYKPPGTRQGYPVPGYKAPAAETPRPAHGPQPGSFPLSASVPKSFFSKQAARAKHSTGWRRLDEPPARPPEPKRQVDASARNVFGQPRLRASLRDLRSPRKSPKSSIEDDLKKLIIMDVASPEPDCDSVSPKMLQRTLSDESLCSGRRDPSYAAPPCFDLVLASDVLSGSTFPSSTLPVRRQPGPGPSLPEKKSAILASELSLVDTRDKPVRRLDPGLMPLPDTAAGLEWSSLVNAAKAYEVQRAVSLFCLHQPGRGPDVLPAPGPAPRPTMSEEPSVDLPGKVCQLEAMLKQLHSDLQKEKQDKVVLQAEVATLRQNNQRLQEESQTATAQLRRFAEIFSGAADAKEP